MKQVARIANSLPTFRFPPEVFERLGGKPTEQEALWTCETCGPIVPRLVANGYLPGKCKCQEQEQADQQRLVIWNEQQAVKRRLAAKCWNWLGETRPREYEVMTLDSFQAESQMQREALSIALDWCEQPTNLILWSKSYGSGKTHLAAALCTYMQQERGWSCLFAECQDLFRAIESRWDDPDAYPDTYSDLVKQAAQCDLLVLDDISHIGKYRKELYEIVDRRHNRAKPTIITLNSERVRVTSSEIIGVSVYIGQAASDRLCDEGLGGLVIYEMTGLSWRRRKR